MDAQTPKKDDMKVKTITATTGHIANFNTLTAWHHDVIKFQDISK